MFESKRLGVVDPTDWESRRTASATIEPQPVPDARRRPRPRGRGGQLFQDLIDRAGIPCEIVLPDGETLSYGLTAPDFRVIFHTARPLKWGLNEFALGQAYVTGEIDIEGDMLRLLDLRRYLNRGRNLSEFWKFWMALLLKAPTLVNRKAIAAHYDFGDDFYLSFIDRRYRFYSHGLFHSDTESLEDASEHKLETMYEALQLGPGKHLLDIGCGWGAVPQYCGPRGVRVTSLTLAEDSYNYTRTLIREQGLRTCEVYLEDFLRHRPTQPYDAIVIYGVIEHIPYYRRFFQRTSECLRPGGLFYLDACAAKEKYNMSDFTRHYIWHGTHTFMCLQDVIQELLFQGLDLLHVEQDTRDYELTMRHWAERFDAQRDAIVDRWGERVYRAFRVYLWGGCHALRHNVLQAYHLVARTGTGPGPRPGIVRRAKHFVASLA